MKKIVLFSMLMLIGINCFGQKVVDVKEQKDYKWGISDEFHSEPGFTGSFWGQPIFPVHTLKLYPLNC